MNEDKAVEVARPEGELMPINDKQKALVEEIINEVIQRLGGYANSRAKSCVITKLDEAKLWLTQC